MPVANLLQLVILWLKVRGSRQILCCSQDVTKPVKHLARLLWECHNLLVTALQDDSWAGAGARAGLLDYSSTEHVALVGCNAQVLIACNKMMGYFLATLPESELKLTPVCQNIL